MKVNNKKNKFSGHFDVTTYSIEENDHIYERDICESKDAVFVLPFDPNTEKVVLIKEKRFGLLKHTNDIETWSSIAGTVDKELSLEEIAAIELMEEAGLDVNDGKLHKICSHYSSPGILSEKKHIFFFQFDSSNFKDGQFGSEAENETTHAKLVDYLEVFQMIERGEVMDLNVMYGITKLSVIDIFEPTV